MCKRKTKQMREFEPILKANDYHEIRSRGSHFIYTNGKNRITVNKDLNKMCKRKTKQMREFEPILKANDYHEIRSRGSHFIYTNGKNRITVNKDLNKMVRLRLIKENNLVEVK